MVRALIVEDNAAFRELLKELLCSRFSALTIDEAVDGEEALKKVETMLPHIIFMDIRLPGKNGLQVTKEIREKHGEAVIVILTYYDLPEHREAAFRYGANYFLTKGTSADDVVNLVASILSNQLESLV